MGFKKTTRNLDFADLAMATCLEQNRSIKLMEQLNNTINWARVESILLSHYTETFAQLVRNFCALTPLIPTFLLFYIKITIRNLLIINALYAMSCSSQLLHTRR
jgi:hypothetical protein